MAPRKQTEPAEPVVEAPAADPAPDEALSGGSADLDTSSGDRPPGEDAADEVTLIVGYPLDEFRPFDDDLLITSAGTTVPADRVDDIKTAARAAGVTIRKVK